MTTAATTSAKAARMTTDEGSRKDIAPLAAEQASDQAIATDGGGPASKSGRDHSRIILWEGVYKGLQNRWLETSFVME